MALPCCFSGVCVVFSGLGVLAEIVAQAMPLAALVVLFLVLALFSLFSVGVHALCFLLFLVLLRALSLVSAFLSGPLVGRAHLPQCVFFCFPRIVCLALFWTFRIRPCLSGFARSRALSRISRMLRFSGFIGHVHVGHVYGFSRIPSCIIKCVRLEYFLLQYGRSIA